MTDKESFFYVACHSFIWERKTFMCVLPQGPLPSDIQVGCERTPRNIIITAGSYYKGHIKYKWLLCGKCVEVNVS